MNAEEMAKEGFYLAKSVVQHRLEHRHRYPTPTRVAFPHALGRVWS